MKHYHYGILAISLIIAGALLVCIGSNSIWAPIGAFSSFLAGVLARQADIAKEKEDD